MARLFSANCFAASSASSKTYEVADTWRRARTGLGVWSSCPTCSDRFDSVVVVVTHTQTRYVYTYHCRRSEEVLVRDTGDSSRRFRTPSCAEGRVESVSCFWKNTGSTRAGSEWCDDCRTRIDPGKGRQPQLQIDIGDKYTARSRRAVSPANAVSDRPLSPTFLQGGCPQAAPRPRTPSFRRMGLRKTCEQSYPAYRGLR